MALFDVSQVRKMRDQWEQLYAAKGKSAYTKTIDQNLAEKLYLETWDFDKIGPELYERQQKNQEAVGLHIPLGITAVMGPGHSGKTTWLKNLYERVNQDKVQYLITGEVGGMIPYSYSYAIEQLEPEGNDVILVDSWKDIWNDWHFANGTLQSGGINTAFTAYLGLLSQCLFLAGKSVIVILNPQTAGEKETVYQMINSQCSGMIRLSSVTPGQVDYAQGRLIPEDVGKVKKLSGVPVYRAPILSDEHAVGSNPMSALFTKPII